MERLMTVLFAVVALTMAFSATPAVATKGDPASVAKADRRALAEYDATLATMAADPSLVKVGKSPQGGAVFSSTTSNVQIEMGARVAPSKQPTVGTTQRVSVGGCGWLKVCIYFGKQEQSYIGVAGIAAITVFICGATGLLACSVASGIATAAGRYVDRNGLCPSSRPRLRVTILPAVGDTQCVG